MESTEIATHLGRLAAIQRVHDQAQKLSDSKLLLKCTQLAHTMAIDFEQIALSKSKVLNKLTALALQPEVIFDNSVDLAQAEQGTQTLFEESLGTGKLSRALSLIDFKHRHFVATERNYIAYQKVRIKKRSQNS